MSNIWEYEWDEEPMKKLEVEYEEYELHLWQSLDSEEGESHRTLSDTPFCGCQDCTTREAIAYFLPKIIDMFNAGEIRTINQQDKENNNAGMWELPFGRDEEHGTSETTG